MSKNCLQRDANLKLSLATPKFHISWLSAYLHPHPFPSFGSFICSYFFMPSLLLHSEWSYHFFNVDTGGWVFKMFNSFIICPTNIPSFYFQTVNLMCTWIQFVHLVWTILSDELIVSCDVSVTPIGKFLFWLAYSHYLDLGCNINIVLTIHVICMRCNYILSHRQNN